MPVLHPSQLDVNQGTNPEITAKHSIFGVIRLLASTLATA
jgi:hypothetical protein